MEATKLYIKLDVDKALHFAYKTGLPVKIGLKSGNTLENVIICKLWDTSFKAKKENTENVEEGNTALKAIVGIHAVDFVEF
jgi:shikimate kinase